MKYKFICEECGKMFDTAAAAEQCEVNHKKEREQRENKQRKLKEVENQAEKTVRELNQQLEESGSHLRIHLVEEMQITNFANHFPFMLF